MDSQGNSKKGPAATDRLELRFVVLRHEGGETGLHWDFIIENSPQAEHLPTWRVPLPPEQWAKASIEAVRLPDHRRLYLDYEGQISGGRGWVKRIEQGTVETLDWQPATMKAFLRGKAIFVHFTATCISGDRWNLDFTDSSNAPSAAIT